MKAENLLILSAVGVGAYFIMKQNGAIGCCGDHAAIGKMYPNYHVLKVEMLGATNHRGDRVKIISDRFKDSVTIPFDYEYGNTAELAGAWLEAHGYEIEGKGEYKSGYYIISKTFEPLKLAESLAKKYRAA